MSSTPMTTCENVGCFTVLPLAEHLNPAGEPRRLCPRHGRMWENGDDLLLDEDEP